jgi:hypothetical protein
VSNIKEPAAGWERDVAKQGMRLLCDIGYHPVLTIPHNDPQAKFDKIKGKAPGYPKAYGAWAPAKNWNDASVKPNPVEAFAKIGRKTGYVPNIGVLCGLPVEIDGEHVGYLTALDVDTACPHVLTTISELFGYSNPVRRGRRGGTFLCITDESVSKDFTRRPDSEGYIDGDDENKIQFLREGKQTVVLGVHPATLKRFQWETAPMDGEPAHAPILPITELPIISTALLEEILAKLGFERGSASKVTSPEEKSALSKREKEIKAELSKTAPLDFEEVDEALGITALIETDAPLKRKLMRDYGEGYDHSTHDLECCNMFRRHLGDKFDHHAARAVLAHFPSCSEEDKQTAHHVARIMAKAEQVKTFAKGEAFGAPVDEEDEEDDANVSPEVQALWDKQAAERADKAERLKSEREAATSNSAELPFEFEHDVAANSTLPDWLVEDLIETKTLAVFYGPPNHGKSLLLLDMLYHVAAGKPWRGRDVKQGCVLFIAVEGPNGTARRAKAWRHHHDIAADVKLPMAFMRVGIDLYKSPKDAKRIVEAVERLETATGLPCRAVAIDTISATTPGMDQNSEMGVFISRCRLILDGTKTASVIAVHHPGKNLAAGLRGDSNLIGAVDMTMLVNNGVAETEKMRDGVSGQTIPFKVTVEMLWENAKGKPVGAPVAIATSAGEAMGAVQDSDDAVTKDTYEDKLIGALNALESCVEFKASAVNEDREDVSVSSITVLAQLNKDRKAARLPELKDRSIIPKLLAKLVAAGKITKTGENKHTEYRLVY